MFHTILDSPETCEKSHFGSNYNFYQFILIQTP